MTVAAYTRSLPRDDLPALLYQADMVRETTSTPGWRFVLAAIADHEQQMLARLLNETTKPDDVPRLRGLLAGLAAMREAADSIVSFAEEAEEKANRATAQEQPA